MIAPFNVYIVFNSPKATSPARETALHGDAGDEKYGDRLTRLTVEKVFLRS